MKANTLLLWLLALATISITYLVIEHQGKSSMLKAPEPMPIYKDGPAKYDEVHRLIRTNYGEDEPSYRVGEVYQAWHKLKAKQSTTKSSQLTFTEHGPANAGGRTRGLIVDPDDPTALTWYAGSVGGGVWKTENGGQSWRHLTEGLGSLATSSLAMSPANTSVIYIGTGEGFGNLDAIMGNGVYRSDDKGETWQILEATTNNPRFANVDRIVVDPNNENILVLCSVGQRIDGQRRSYIMKSTDGGETWRTSIQLNDRIQQIVSSPTSFDTLYATVNGAGILRSTDAGDRWETIYDVSADYNVRRIEMAIAPQNPNKIYLACENTTSGSRLLYTDDAFATVKNSIFEPRQPDWLASQGWYDNTIAVHPYNEDEVWVAGQSAMMALRPTEAIDSLKIFERFENRADFLVEVDQNTISSEAGGYLQDFLGEVGFPDGTQLDYNEIERATVRFGTGFTSKAHLFIFDFLSDDLVFQGMIDVPFYAEGGDSKDTLTLTIIDFDEDGEWTLKDYSDEDFAFLDMVFLHSIPYDTIPNPVLVSGNPVYKGLYYFSLGLSPDYSGDLNDLPNGRLIFSLTDEQGFITTFEPITDGYSRYADIEPVGSKGVHVDHHNIIFIPRDSVTKSFYVLNANDGGVAFSDDNGQTFLQTGDTFNGGGQFETSDGFNVTQFYGIDKMNGAMRFVGGTQDNGSWVSPENPDAASKWVEAPSGDGFEAVWKYDDTDQLIESSQFNRIYKSYDGGENWTFVTLPGGGGPFVTRIASSQINPDLLFMVSEEGVLRSTDFAESWEVIDMPGGWSYNRSWGPPIKISLADPDVVWTGQNNQGQAAVSLDGGLTFTAANSYTSATLGTITGISTHPFDKETAYLLFSQANTPKILKTTDAGQSWEDISGFGSNRDESLRGFPDVAVYCMLVMPFNTDMIWVGTEIGLLESFDGGQSWALASYGFPATAIWDMRIVNDVIVFATHGRGIWTVNVADLPTSTADNVLSNKNLSLYPNPAVDELIIELSEALTYGATISIMDKSGAVVKKVVADQELMRIDISALPAGWYVAQVSGHSGMQESFVKLH